MTTPNLIDPVVMNALAQIVTALGVIATAVSSILNRKRLISVDQKVDRAVVVAAETKQEAVKTQQVTERKIAEVKEAVAEATVAATKVNVAVLQKVHEAGVEAGRELEKNGHG